MLLKKLATRPPESMCSGMSLHYAYFQSCAPRWRSPVLVVKVRGLLQKVIPWDYRTLWLPSGGAEDIRQIFEAYEQCKKNTKVFLSCCSQLPVPVSHGCNICCPIKQQLQLEFCPGLDHFIASPFCTCSQCFIVGGTTRVPYSSPGINASPWHVLLQQHQMVVTPNVQQRSHCICGWEGRSSTFSPAMWNWKEWGNMLKLLGKGFWIWEQGICCGIDVCLSMGNATLLSRTELGKKLVASGRWLNLTSKNLGFKLWGFKAEVGSETCSWKRSPTSKRLLCRLGMATFLLTFTAICTKLCASRQKISTVNSWSQWTWDVSTPKAQIQDHLQHCKTHGVEEDFQQPWSARADCEKHDMKGREKSKYKN